MGKFDIPPKSFVLMTAEALAQCAELACILEVQADKPGNVTLQKSFADTNACDYLRAAKALALNIPQNLNSGLGEMILTLVKTTRKETRGNPNLGIILLFSPLLLAYNRGDLRKNLSKVLLLSDGQDTLKVYEAIRLARPGGLGRVPKGDVLERPTMSLAQAMDLAKERDTIAREYVTDFQVTFEFSTPRLIQHMKTGIPIKEAVVQTYIEVLAHYPDSLISRREGMEVSQKVSEKAKKVIDSGGVFSSKGKREIEVLDRFLRSKRNRLNPGTTADLVTVSILIAAVLGQIDFPPNIHNLSLSGLKKFREISKNDP